MADDRSRSRRAFLSGLGRSAALVVTSGALAKVATAAPHLGPHPVDDVGASGPPAPATTRIHDDLPPAPDAAVHAYLAPIAVGSTLGSWTLTRIHGVFRGGLPLVLTHADGRRAQIDLLRHDAASPPGIASTAAGHLYLVNSGRGNRTTPPDLEAALRLLAHALRHRAGAELPLVSQAERHRQFPGGVYVVPA